MIPLFPFLLIIQSSFRSKLSNSSSVTISQSPRIFCCFFINVSRQSVPFRTFQTESILPPPYRCHPFELRPLNNNFHPSFFSATVSTLSPPVTCLEEPQERNKQGKASTTISFRMNHY